MYSYQNMYFISCAHFSSNLLCPILLGQDWMKSMSAILYINIYFQVMFYGVFFFIFRGKDVVHQMNVTLRDLYNSSTRKLSLQKHIICPKCAGVGGKKPPEQCPPCKGTGRQVGMCFFFQKKNSSYFCKTLFNYIKKGEKICVVCFFFRNKFQLFFVKI